MVQTTIIQQKPSYTSAWVCFILGFFLFPICIPLWIASIILFINTKPIIVTNVINQGNVENNSDENITNLNNGIVAEHSETTIAE